MANVADNDRSIQINIYQSNGAWYGAIWIEGEYDSCDPLPCEHDASDAVARHCAETMPLLIAGRRNVVRVDDESVSN